MPKVYDLNQVLACSSGFGKVWAGTSALHMCILVVYLPFVCSNICHRYFVSLFLGLSSEALLLVVMQLPEGKQSLAPDELDNSGKQAILTATP